MSYYEIGLHTAIGDLWEDMFKAAADAASAAGAGVTDAVKAAIPGVRPNIPKYNPAIIQAMAEAARAKAAEAAQAKASETSSVITPATVGIGLGALAVGALLMGRRR